jgi:hypothetical protein
MARPAMAKEIRRIVMEPHEFQAIMALYLASGDNGLPQGYVIDFKQVETSPVVVSVNIQEKDGRQEELRFDEHQLVSSFISFCLNRRIPVPRAAKKNIKISDENVIFDIVLDLDV